MDREQIYEAFDNGLIGLDDIIDISQKDGYNQALEDFVENISLPMTEEQKEKDCNNCANATDDFNNEVDNGCYMCCKGLENNYVPIK